MTETDATKGWTTGSACCGTGSNESGPSVASCCGDDAKVSENPALVPLSVGEERGERATEPAGARAPADDGLGEEWGWGDCGCG